MITLTLNDQAIFSDTNVATVACIQSVLLYDAQSKIEGLECKKSSSLTS